MARDLDATLLVALDARWVAKSYQLPIDSSLTLGARSHSFSLIALIHYPSATRSSGSAGSRVARCT